MNFPDNENSKSESFFWFLLCVGPILVSIYWFITDASVIYLLGYMILYAVLAFILFALSLFITEPKLFKIAIGMGNKSKPASIDYSQVQKNAVLSSVDKHSDVLVRKYMQLVKTDDYGNVDDKKWKEEIVYFVNNTIGELPGDRICLTGEEIAGFIQKHVLHHVKDMNNKLPIYNEDMDGIEYEHYCAKILNKSGWEAKVTTASGDQGVDVVAKKNHIVVAIQCKKYSSPVGNKAVQEINAGKGFINANKAIVVSNASYTPSAKELANKLEVGLFHHADLTRLIELV